MLARVVLVRVTAGTIRFIGAEPPGDDLTLGSMTGDTRHTGIVLGIGRRCMVEFNRRYPGIGGMTGIA